MSQARTPLAPGRNGSHGVPGRNGRLSTAELTARVQELIGDDLAKTEQIFAAELTGGHPYVQDVLTHLTRYRGKRLRPMLVLLSGHAVGSVTENHHKLAAVVEMIHTATLVHDDVLDEADTRRHVATINSRWNTETSVLLGDHLFTHAFHLAADTGSAEACRRIGAATNRVCEGELTQIHHRGNLDLTEAEYLDILDGKTAELTAISAELGGRYAGADDTVVAGLRDYGRCLGIAFQIADDLLDLLGDESETGKTLGTDLRGQKLTLPIIRLLSRTPEPDRSELRDRLTEVDDSTVSYLLPKLRESDALEYTHGRAMSYIAEAKAALSVLPESPARTLLETLAEFTIRRER